MKLGRSSGGAANGMASWCSIPLWSVWNDADIEKMVSPCWIALTRLRDERAAVAEPFDDEDRGRLGVAGPQEVSVQRVHLKLRVHRSHRRDQGLAGDVAAECALQETGFGAEHAPAVDVDLELLEIEDLLDRHACGYQPRSASRCGSAISSTLMPTMASPSPRDTLASTSGSS